MIVGESLTVSPGAGYSVVAPGDFWDLRGAERSGERRWTPLLGAGRVGGIVRARTRPPRRDDGRSPVTPFGGWGGRCCGQRPSARGAPPAPRLCGCCDHWWDGRSVGCWWWVGYSSGPCYPTPPRRGVGRVRCPYVRRFLLVVCFSVNFFLSYFYSFGICFVFLVGS